MDRNKVKKYIPLLAVILLAGVTLLADSFSGGGGSGGGGAMTQISVQTVSSPTASVTFSNIPGTYNSLALYISARGDTAATSVPLDIQFNADTGSNYNYMQQTSGGNFTGVTQTAIQWCSITGATGTANFPGELFGTIVNYASTSFVKTITGLAGFSQSGIGVAPATGVCAGSWNSATAITSIKLFPNAGNIASGVFSLYGIN